MHAHIDPRKPDECGKQKCRKSDPFSAVQQRQEHRLGEHVHGVRRGKRARILSADEKPAAVEVNAFVARAHPGNQRLDDSVAHGIGYGNGDNHEQKNQSALLSLKVKKDQRGRDSRNDPKSAVSQDGKNRIEYGIGNGVVEKQEHQRVDMLKGVDHRLLCEIP